MFTGYWSKWSSLLDSNYVNYVNSRKSYVKNTKWFIYLLQNGSTGSEANNIDTKTGNGDTRVDDTVVEQAQEEIPVRRVKDSESNQNGNDSDKENCEPEPSADDHHLSDNNQSNEADGNVNLQNARTDLHAHNTEGDRISESKADDKMNEGLNNEECFVEGDDGNEGETRWGETRFSD